jgi:hypothetical protein
MNSSSSKIVSVRETVAITIVWILLMAGCMFLGSGCSSPSEVPSGTIESVSSIVSGYVLKTQVPDDQRKEVAGQVHAIAAGVRALAAGRAPTVDQVKEAILAFGGNKTRWASLSNAVGGVYGDFYKRNVTEDDTKAALAVLEAIAAGIEEGAKTIEEE